MKTFFLLLAACSDHMDYPVSVDPGEHPDAGHLIDAPTRACKNVNNAWSTNTQTETLEVYFVCVTPADAGQVQGEFAGAATPQPVQFDLVCGNNFFTLSMPTYQIDEFHQLTLSRVSAQLFDVSCTR